eukprot:250992_1
MDPVVHKSIIVSQIVNATNIQPMVPILEHVDINEKIKQLLLNTLKHETTEQEITKIYLSTQSITDILSCDVVLSVIAYLRTAEIYKCTAIINKTFNQLSKSAINLSYMNSITYQKMLYHCDGFAEIFDNSDGDYYHQNNVKIGYFLQNRYDLATLNKSSFDELGDVLKKQDKSVWDLCTKFRFKSKLRGFVESDTRESYWMFPIESIEVEYDDWWSNSCDKIHYPVEFDIEISQNKVQHARTTAISNFHGMWRGFPICPFINIECPNMKWRTKFVKNMESKLSQIKSQ